MDSNPYYKYRFQKKPLHLFASRTQNRIILFDKGAGYWMHMLGLIVGLATDPNRKSTIICIDYSGFLNDKTMKLLNAHTVHLGQNNIVMPNRVNIIPYAGSDPIENWLFPQIRSLSELGHVDLVVDSAHWLHKKLISDMIPLRCNTHLYANTIDESKFKTLHFDKRIHVGYALKT